MAFGIPLYKINRRIPPSPYRKLLGGVVEFAFLFFAVAGGVGGGWVGEGSFYFKYDIGC